MSSQPQTTRHTELSMQHDVHVLPASHTRWILKPRIGTTTTQAIPYSCLAARCDHLRCCGPRRQVQDHAPNNWQRHHNSTAQTLNNETSMVSRWWVQHGKEHYNIKPKFTRGIQLLNLAHVEISRSYISLDLFKHPGMLPGLGRGIPYVLFADLEIYLIWQRHVWSIQIYGPGSF